MEATPIKITGKVVFISNPVNGEKSQFVNIWSDTKASKTLEAIFEDFKEDPNFKIVPGEGRMGGARQLGAVTITPEGLIRITTGGTHAIYSEVDHEFECELELAVKGESYGSGKYSKTGFKISNFINYEILDEEAEIKKEMRRDMLKGKLAAKYSSASDKRKAKTKKEVEKQPVFEEDEN